MATFTDYEISRFQDVLFAADSFDDMDGRLRAHLQSIRH